MLWQYTPQGFTRLFSRKRFLSSQKESRLIGFAVSREAAQRRSVELSIVARVIAGREVVEQGGPAVKNGGLTVVGTSDVPHLSKERCLFPKVGSLHAAEEKVETVGMTCAIVAGEAIHIDAEEYPADVRCNLIDPVETHEPFVIVRVGPVCAAIRNITDRIIEGHRRREALLVFGHRRHDVVEHLVIRTVQLEP